MVGWAPPIRAQIKGPTRPLGLVRIRDQSNTVHLISFIAVVSRSARVWPSSPLPPPLSLSLLCCAHMVLYLFLGSTPTVLQYFSFQLLDQLWLKDSTRKPPVVSHLSQLQSILWRLYEYRQLGEPLDRSLVLEIFGPRVTAKKKDLSVRKFFILST